MSVKSWCLGVAALGLILAAICTAQAAGNIPEACTKGGSKLPVWFHCSKPYVEMQRDSRDSIFERVWYCRETDHSLGLIREGNGGCGGSKGLSMFPGWSVPETRSSPAVMHSTNDLLAEIDEHVINPCLLVGVRGTAAFSQMDESAVLDFLRKKNPGDVQTMRDAILPLAEGKNLDERMALYSRASKFCGNEIAGSRSVRVEPDAIFGSKLKGLDDRQKLLEELVGKIRARGWKCDSISSARRMVFSRGFEVNCNGYAYEYVIEDKGGKWVVRLD